MKKAIFLIGILCFFFSNQVRAETIDQMEVINEELNLVRISGTFSAGCERSTELQTTVLDEQVIINIYTEPSGACSETEVTSFSFTTAITPPADSDGTPLESYEIIAIMYQGTLGSDGTWEIDTGEPLASMTLAVGSETPGDEQPDDELSEDELPDQPDLEVYLSIRPKILKIGRMPKHLGAKIRLSEGYLAEDVDLESIELGVLTDGGESPTIFPERSKGYKDLLFMKFDIEEIVDIARSNFMIDENDAFPSKITLFILGELWDGTSFYATDDVRIKNFRKHRRCGHHFRAKSNARCRNR